MLQWCPIGVWAESLSGKVGSAATAPLSCAILVPRTLTWISAQDLSRFGTLCQLDVSCGRDFPRLSCQIPTAGLALDPLNSS